MSPDLLTTIYKVLNSNFFGVLAGTLASAIGFFIAGWITKRANQREEDEKYRTLLRSTIEELSFNRVKLLAIQKNIDVRKGHVSDFIRNVEIDFFPAFLEQSKMELSKFLRNESIVNTVSHCHFELANIRYALSEFHQYLVGTNRQLSSMEGTFSRLHVNSNARSLNNRLGEVALLFEEAVSEIQRELEKRP